MIIGREPLGDIARLHRERWVTARCGDRAIVRLRGGDGVAQLLAELQGALSGDPPGALVLLDELPDDGLSSDVIDALALAVDRSWAVVVAVPGRGDELPSAPDSDPEGLVALLAGRLPGATVIPQHLAQASIIAAPGPLTASVDGQETVPGDIEAWLVVAGLPDDNGPEPLALAIGSVHRAYARWLDAANASLRRANLRMARERLGTHDSAAASVAHRVATAEAERENLRAELGQVRNEAMQYFQITQRRLNEPHHRVAEGIVRRARRLPGARRVGKAVIRLLQPPGD